MTPRFKLVFWFLAITFCSISYSLSAQTEGSERLITQLKELYLQGQYDRMIKISKDELQKTKGPSHQDSIFRAKVYLYQYKALHRIKNSISNMPSIDKGISYCPNSSKGDSLKAVLYNKKAYLESNLGSTIKSYKGILSSVKLLENLSNPNPGYLMGGYLLLASKSIYYGNLEQSKRYMRLAEDIYAKNKVEIDKNTWELNGNNHRFGVIAKYRKISMLYGSAKSAEDSLTLINTMKSLEDMHNQPDFHKEESIYYTTALNHVGDWYISHENDSVTTPESTNKGLEYLHKALDYVENKGYSGTIWAIKYNIAKGYIRGNQLEKADSTMAVLFRGISSTDGRLPFFLAQKALIKAKKKQKDSAISYFHQSIEKIHTGKETLTTGYVNFKPSTSYNHTRLLLRIHEELDRHYKKDSVLQKNIARLPFMALQQFENSYLSTSFNAKQNKQLRKIIQGVLKSRKTGLLKEQLPQKTILNKFEIFKNQLSWKKFYENRYTNSLPELDSIKRRQVELASLLTKARIETNIGAEDSINQLAKQHQVYKKEQFPQLKLLSDFEFSIEQLQKKLYQNELVLKYLILENEIAIYQVSKHEIHLKTIPWKHQEEQLSVAFIHRSRDRNYNDEIATELGKLLLPKIDEGITHLIINPDGILNKIPFETLQVKGNLLVQDYNIRYTSNLGFVHYNPDSNAPSGNVHIYAPRYDNLSTSDVRNSASFLEGASQEAKSIDQLFPSTLFDDKTLNKSKFIDTSGDAKILHLAMHAEVNSDHSQFSRLLFSSNLDKEEDHLYLEELYGLSLSADLAILSACNTGTGLEKNGNLESFQRAFTFAGVPSTVASLWEVPDASTKQIMILFYKNLKKGQSKSEALRNAKLTYQDQHLGTKLAAPYFWAGFVVYGSDAPVIEESHSYLLYVFSALIGFTILIGYQKRKLRANS